MTRVAIGPDAPVIDRCELSSAPYRIRPGVVTHVTFRPQRSLVCVHAFRVENAERWKITDVIVGGIGQRFRAFLYKGGMVTPRHHVQVGQDCVVEVEYIGSDPEGEPFHAESLGYEVDRHRSGA